MIMMMTMMALFYVESRVQRHCTRNRMVLAQTAVGWLIWRSCYTPRAPYTSNAGSTWHSSSRTSSHNLTSILIVHVLLLFTGVMQLMLGLHSTPTQLDKMSSRLLHLLPSDDATTSVLRCSGFTARRVCIERYMLSWSGVCLSVCLSVTRVYCVETTELSSSN